MADYYDSEEACEKASREYKNTNERYRNFCQKYFTAGDEEQFQNARDWSNSTYEVECQTHFQFDIWDGYHASSGDSITNTFAYIFHKFKKGIYVRIKENKLVTFLPFSKAKFVNEWGNRIHIDPKYKNAIEFFRHIYDMEGRPFNERRVNKFTDEWYANNCLLRYEFPLSEGDTGTSHMKNMFEELCEHRKVPDLEFFVNRRDFPLLKRDFTEPYDHMFDSDSFPLLSHRYENYAPIFSSVTKSNFADLPIPTIDDWARVKSIEGAYFHKTHTRQYHGDFSLPWEERINTAVFRGASTGYGTTIETNPRLKASYLSQSTQNTKDPVPLLDAGITDWNLRPRKIKGQKYLQTIDITKLPFGLVSKLSPEQQTRYKYILHIEGHACAFRLSLELSMGSTILLVQSEYNLWFFHLLKPYEHFVPVKKDLSDLFEQIKWCRMNDDKCKKIAENGRKFFQTYLQKEALFDYLQSLLMETKKKVGYFKYPKEKWTDRSIRQEYNFVWKNCMLPEKCVKKDLLFRSRNTEVYDCGNNCIVKYGKQKKEELFRDVFVFKQGALEGIDNFVQIRGIDKDGGVVQNRHEGMTLLDWLKKDYNETDFISILLQLALSLFVAQNKSGFVHNDLMPWNVIIQKKGELFEPRYKIFHQVYKLQSTRVYPVIIDYGKAHVVYDNVHHGLLNPFKMEPVRDLLMLVFSSISALICGKASERKLRGSEEQFLLHLVNFFCPSKIIETKFHSFTKMRHFIGTHSSFTIMASMNIDIQKTNLDFVQYLDKFQRIYNTEETKSHSQRSISKTLPEMKFGNKVLVYHFFQTLNDPQFFPQFLQYLQSTTDKVLETKIDFQLPDEIYLNKGMIEKVLQSENEIDATLLEKKYLLAAIFEYEGVYKVVESDRKPLSELFRKLDLFSMMHRLANVQTLKDMLLSF